MTKIVFSSSDYSDSSEIEMLPKAEIIEKKPIVQPESESSDDSGQEFVVKQPRPASRPINNRNIVHHPVRRGPAKPSVPRKPNTQNTIAKTEQIESNQKIEDSAPNTSNNPHQNIRSKDESDIKRRRQPNPHNHPKPPENPAQKSRPTPPLRDAGNNNKNNPVQTQKSVNPPKPPIEQDNYSDSDSNSDKQITQSEQRSPKIHNISLTQNPHNDSDAVIISPHIPQKELNTSLHTPTKVQRPIFSPKTFSIQRVVKHSIIGSNYTFILIRNGNPYLYSKCSSRHPKNFMNISEDSTFKNVTDYTFIPENGCKKFTLYKSGKTQMTYTIDIPSKVPKLPHLKVILDESFNFTPKTLVSKRPTMSKRGFFFLDFHNKFTLPSQKNAIFIDDSPDGADNDLLIVRKVENDRIEIDVNCEQNELLLFCIGLSSFLGKLT